MMNQLELTPNFVFPPIAETLWSVLKIRHATDQRSAAIEGEG